MSEKTTEVFVQAGLSEGSVPEGYEWGKSAFAGLEEAVSATGADDGIGEVSFVFGSDFQEDWESEARFSKATRLSALDAQAYGVGVAPEKVYVEDDLAVSAGASVDFTQGGEKGVLVFDSRKESEEQRIDIDGTLKVGGMDRVWDNPDSGNAVVSISASGRLLSADSADNSCLCVKALAVRGEGTAESLTREDIQLNLGGFGHLYGDVSIDGAWVNLATIGQSEWHEGGAMTVSDSVLRAEAALVENGQLGVVSAKDVTITDSDVVVGALEIQGNGVSVDGGRLAVTPFYSQGGVIAAGGQVNLAAGTSLSLSGVAFSCGALVNDGTVSLDWATLQHDAYGIAGYSGTGILRIDATGTDGDSFTIAESTELQDVSRVIITARDYDVDSYYRIVQADGALTALDTRVISVNAAWTEETDLADGLVWGVTAFSGLDEAIAAQKGGDRTYRFTADADMLTTFHVAMTAGSTTLSIQDARGKTVGGANIASSRSVQAEFQGGKTYDIVFSGADGQYSVTTESLKAVPNEDVDLGSLGTTSGAKTLSADGSVGYGTGAQNFTFEVAEGTSAFCSFAVAPADGTSMPRVSYSLRSADGKTYVYGTTDGNAIRNVELGGGSYVLAVEAFGSGTEQRSSDFRIRMDGMVNADVTHADDTVAETVKAVAVGAGLEGFVGLGDKRDCMALDLDGKDGEFSVRLSVSEGQDASGLILSIVEYTPAAGGRPAREEVLTHGVFRGGELTLDGLFLNKDRQYYATIKSPTSEASFRNANYSLTLERTQDLTGMVSTADDVWQDVESADAVSEFTNWIGDVDAVDWCKLDAATDAALDARGGKVNIVTLKPVDDTVDDMVIGTLYRVKQGYSDIIMARAESMGVVLYGKQSEGANIAKAEVACASGYDYYAKFTSISGNGNYTMSIAAK